jgi:hypothetical protein
VGTSTLPDDILEAIPGGCYLLDARVGSLTPDSVEKARQKGVHTIRASTWPALAGRLAAAHESEHLYHKAMGWKDLAGVPIVAGGAVGTSGAVIVDDINRPSRIIGIADGTGGMLPDIQDEHRKRLQAVQEEINRVSIMPDWN